jgi:hypothetical protein
VRGDSTRRRGGTSVRPLDVTCDADEGVNRHPYTAAIGWCQWRAPADRTQVSGWIATVQCARIFCGNIEGSPGSPHQPEHGRYSWELVPAALDHCSFPLLLGAEDVVRRAADLRIDRAGTVATVSVVASSTIVRHFRTRPSAVRIAAGHRGCSADMARRGRCSCRAAIPDRDAARSASRGCRSRPALASSDGRSRDRGCPCLRFAFVAPTWRTFPCGYPRARPAAASMCFLAMWPCSNECEGDGEPRFRELEPADGWLRQIEGLRCVA